MYTYILLYYIILYILTYAHCMFNMISIWICVYKIRIICNVCNMYIIFQYCCQQVELLHYEILLSTSSFKLGSKRGKKSRLFLRALSQGLRVGGEEQDTEGNRCQGVFLQFYMAFLDAFRPRQCRKERFDGLCCELGNPLVLRMAARSLLDPQILWLSSRTLGVSWVT